MTTQNSFEIKWKLVKSKIAFTFGLSSSERSVGKISALIGKIHSLTLLTLVLRKGYHQDGKPWNEKEASNFKKRNDFLRLCLLIMILRFIFFIFTEEPSNITMILGNAFYSSTKSRTLNLLELIYISMLVIAREYILYCESKGRLSFLLDMRTLNTSLNSYALKMSPVQFDLFVRRVQFTLFNWSNLFYPFSFILVLGLAIVRLMNVQVYFNLIYLVSSAIWFIPETATVVCLVWGLAAIGTYSFILSYFYLAWLQSQLDRLRILRRSTQSAEMNYLLKSVNFDLQKVFLHFDRMANDLNYLIGYAVFGISFMMVIAISFSNFLKLHSPLLANVILIATFLGVVCMTAILHSSTQIYTKYNQICGYYSSFMARQYGLQIHNGLKILHILEKCSYNGIRIGDLTLLTSTFLCYFILENISAIMLITVNIRSFES
uniref:Gustatory receptor n=1 Tax=Tetranychus urticae TaxID=32264 RepID=T1K1T5_TETUR